MALFGNGIDRASAEARKLKEARATLEQRTAVASQELETLRAQLPDWQLESVLGSIEASEKVQDARRRIPALEAELTSVPALEKRLIAKLRDAIRGLNHAKAVVILSDVEKLRKELDAHQGRTATLLQQLQAHENCAFIPHRGLATMAPGLQASDIPFFITKSEAMQNKIHGLLAEVNAIESKPVGGGAANASSLDELLQAAASVDPESIPPSPSAIRTWFAGALVEAEEGWRRTSSDFAGSETLPRETSIMLAWNAAAEISPDSRVTFRIAPVSREVAMQTFGAEYVRNPAAD